MTTDPKPDAAERAARRIDIHSHYHERDAEIIREEMDADGVARKIFAKDRISIKEIADLILKGRTEDA